MTIQKTPTAAALEPKTKAAAFQNEHHTPTEFHKGAGSGLRRIALLALAAVFFVLGSLGVLLPGLPATPFLLLTSYFLVRSSPALNARLLRSRIFGPILIDWQVHGGVRNQVRWKAIAFVTVTIAVTLAVAGYSKSVSATVIGLACVGILVILKLPTAKHPPAQQPQDSQS